jgi:hypothetical protein
MFTPHSLSGPEITTLLAALGLVMNACITLFISLKQSSQRIPARYAVWIRHGNAKKRPSHD